VLALTVLALALEPDAARDLERFAQLAAFIPAVGVVVGALVGEDRGPPGSPGLLRRRWVRLLMAGVAVGGAVASSPVGAAWGALPGRGAALAVLSGLFLTGAALAPTRAEPAARARAGIGRAALLLLICWCADGAAAGWGVLRPAPPWSPEVASWLLDLSPETLLMESAGVDWMRHPAVYEAAGTDRIGPGLRAVFVGPVAGSATLLVGCAATAARALMRRRAIQR